MDNKKLPVAVAITGASGVIYALRLLEQLFKADETVYLMKISLSSRTITSFR